MLSDLRALSTILLLREGVLISTVLWELGAGVLIVKRSSVDLSVSFVCTQGLVHVPWELHNDGRPHTYSVPLHEYFQVTSGIPIPN